MGNGTRLAGVFVGLLFTPIALLWAIASAGGGHGHYVAAKVLFPLPMLLSIATGSIGLISFLLAVVQFPIYGWLFGRIASGGSYSTVIAVVAVHFLAVLLCFAGLLHGF